MDGRARCKHCDAVHDTGDFYEGKCGWCGTPLAAELEHVIAEERRIQAILNEHDDREHSGEFRGLI